MDSKFSPATTAEKLSHSYELPLSGETETLTSPYSKAILLQEGACEVILDGTLSRLTPGDIVCLPPGTPHILRADGPCLLGVVIFVRGVHDLELHNRGLLRDQSGKFRRTFELVLELQGAEDPQLRATVYCLHCALFGILSRLGSVARQSHIDKVDEVFQAIQTQFMNPDFDISAEIEKTGYCQSHFRRIFREIIGRPPLQQLNYVRINFAKTQMLLYGDLYSLKQLSQNAGFRDSFFFSRMFSKYVGMSPTEYLQQLKSGVVPEDLPETRS